MKTFILTLITFCLLNANAIADSKIIFELGIGLGTSGTTSTVKPKNSLLSNCALQRSTPMRIANVRLQHNRYETTIGRMWHDNKVCNRNNTMVGFGYVFSTEKLGYENDKSIHASWTPSIVFMKQPTWRLPSKVQMGNRFTVGGGQELLDVELSYLVYGLKNNGDNLTFGESFLTIAASLKNLDKERNKLTDNNTSVGGSGDNETGDNENGAGDDETGNDEPVDDSDEDDETGNGEHNGHGWQHRGRGHGQHHVDLD